VVNVDGLARDAGIARKTAENYLEILSDTLIAFLLPAFEGRLRVRERRHPKLYWVDPGLPRAAKRQIGRPAAEEKWHLLEGSIAGLLRAYRDYRGAFDDVYYWQPTESVQTEVDFLLRRDNEYVAIEVKSGSRVDSTSLKRLRAVQSLSGLRRCFLIYHGSQPMETEDGIEVLPIQKFSIGSREVSRFEREAVRKKPS
jgi:hypothetical protein